MCLVGEILLIGAGEIVCLRKSYEPDKESKRERLSG